MIYIDYPKSAENQSDESNYSDGNISSVKQIVSNVNLDDMKDQLEVEKNKSNNFINESSSISANY